ncbi:MAG: glutamate racemase [Candidatus Thiodiazotropha sp. (ex Lucinoma aequizonata)]|nr:glutamate racemase [Candidatus Thiodiazotropha sp. (ex Lucinoma aequizonata)]MCU7887534.1 glutamate racemase [Candidatus Thiodiazotropha sp. (ex Lucinoma aequizonata)]MCU7895348.1 glutamate racemase [Candidatus Thiodiazotropha sp. (ex Lucinoma aequizonata)]MCU7897198.1 glutamate racemase [Candidatus Thiodiazotropha sp. (ex Lucinoma aequizonata)]MCU7901918.1 glutamate racemase [Candidatus Thiodiazotropha sp. (ex Lucinoma aequizonata)]
MRPNQSVGIFDSGIGGLSVVQHIRDLLPAESLIYVSDRAHLPYGTKDKQFILDRTAHITDFLMQQNVKAIIIACNTATAIAVADLRRTLPIPIIGMEPGLKPAAARSHNGLIGVLATEGTLDSGKFKRLMHQHANSAEVIICPCHGWVEAIEHDRLNNRHTIELVEQQLQPILDKGVDTLVLGCTHYPFVRDIIQRVAGESVSIIDTGLAVAKHLQKRLAEEGILSTNQVPGSESYWCSAPTEKTRELIEKLQGKSCVINSLPITVNNR